MISPVLCSTKTRKVSRIREFDKYTLAIFPSHCCNVIYVLVFREYGSLIERDTNEME